MKDKLAYSIALALLAGFAVSVSAEEIPLFGATPITNSALKSPTNSAAVDINNNRFVYDSAETTVFCADAGTAHLRTVGDAENHLIVDNYVTLNDADNQSICTGGSSINGNGSVITSGTHCFDSGSSSSGVLGDAINTVFNSDATAPVSLSDGQNDLLFKLWDYGAVFGNTALELALPENCSSVPITTTNLCAAQDTDIGDVNVWNDSEHLYVEFEITEQGWFLDETHVAVGVSDDMTNKAGNPAPGQFPYACEIDGDRATKCSVKIALDGLEGSDDGTVAVAAHAAAFKILSNGCGNDPGDAPAFASEVMEGGNMQGVRKDGTAVLPERSEPEAVFSATNPAAPDAFSFFSLGFDGGKPLTRGSLTVGFGQRFANGSSADVCVQEVTFGRDGFPEENAEVFGDAALLGEISNKDSYEGNDGMSCVGLPDDVSTAEYVTLLDTTDPEIHNNVADGYDVDWITACYPVQDETAWGAACPSDEGDAEGNRFTDRGNWGTYFEYEIQ